MLFIISCSLDHAVMGIVATLWLLIVKHDIHINATCSLTSVSYLSLMNLLLYLLSTICAHPYYFPHIRMGKWTELTWWLSRWILGLMSTSQYSYNWSRHKRVIFLFLLHCVKTMWWNTLCNKQMWWYFIFICWLTCDWSLGTHKIMHSILSLKMGMTGVFPTNNDSGTQTRNFISTCLSSALSCAPPHVFISLIFFLSFTLPRSIDIYPDLLTSS
jgi:hypothetical protein